MTRPMKLAAASLAVVALGLAAGCGVPAPPPAPVDSFVLNSVTLIDGNGGAPVAGAAVVVTDGRIAWVGPAAEVKAPAGAAVHDLSGKFLMPGIIDLHTHIAVTDGVTQDPQRFFTRENVNARLAHYAQYGVTSVLSTGTDQPLVYEIRAEQRAGRPSVARIFTAGRGFTNTGGYPSQVLPTKIPYELERPEDAAVFMKELAARHPDVTKLWVDDYFGTMKKITMDMAKTFVEAAHANGLKAMAHVFYLQDAKQLADAGINGFIHNIRDRPVDAALIASMKAHDTWLISSTLSREASMFAYATPEALLADPFFTRSVPESLQATMRSPAAIAKIKADPHFAKYPSILKTAQQNLKKLVDGGVKFGFGTDSGPPGRYGGYADLWEMELMVEAGLTPAQVLLAATRSGSEFLGAKDIGTVEVGKWADLLVLGANPLDDIKNIRNVDAVYIAGNKVR